MKYQHCFSLLAGLLVAAAHAAPPNIVYILADDMGYGDVTALNPDSKIKTPHLDQLAGEGMVLTDAHSSSSVCTPTRYGLLTGRYNWRSRMKKGVLMGYSPRLIEPDRITVADLLRKQGYHTTCVGKWHLGMDWPEGEDRFTKPIKNGPTAVGFDHFWGISASLDMPPYVYINDSLPVAVPSVTTGAFGRRGLAAEGLDPSDVLPDLTDHAVEVIRERATTARNGTPFFLYFPLPAPHTPIAPTDEWKGKSGLNKYGDFVMQVDSTVGRITQALKDHGLQDDTLIVFTADNGCSPAAKIPEMHAKGHYPNHHFRGHKADIFEGGHRVPFIVRWPGKVKAGSSSDQLTCLTDLMATCADITGAKLPPNAGEDSVSILPALLGKAAEPLREAVVHHSINGSFAIRSGKWKLIFCPGSGGWSAPRPGKAGQGLPSQQLYNLEEDIRETTNLEAAHPEVVTRLTKLMEQYVDKGRSTPGPKQANTGATDFRTGQKTSTLQKKKQPAKKQAR